MSVTTQQAFRLKELILSGEVRLKQDDLKLMLLRPGYIHNDGFHQYSDIEGLEVIPTITYPKGGELATGKSVYTNDQGDAYFQVGTCVYGNLETTVRHAVMYADIEIPSLGLSKPILFITDFGVDLEFKNAVFMFSWPDALMRWGNAGNI